MKEKWQWARNHKHYYKLSSFGRVELVKPITFVYLNRGKFQSRKTIKPGMLKISPSKFYPRVRLYFPNGEVEAPRVHILMLETFVGPCPPGKECRHLNDNKTNFRLDNLKWGSRKANVKDAIRNGCKNYDFMTGERNFNSVLTRSIVRKLKSKSKKWKGSQRAFCKKYSQRLKISAHTIRACLRNRSWNHVEAV